MFVDILYRDETTVYIYCNRLFIIRLRRRRNGCANLNSIRFFSQNRDRIRSTFCYSLQAVYPLQYLLRHRFTPLQLPTAPLDPVDWKYLACPPQR